MGMAQQRQAERRGFYPRRMFEQMLQGFTDPFRPAGRVLLHVHDDGKDFIPQDSKRTQFIGRKIVKLRIQMHRMHYYWE